ncbi:MAG: thioredoxin-disulfide reductase [Bacteroidetes bacterium]|nr:thioredoxin-disulfide reductase [Bacteroidota bacterium]MBX7044949.1 thioredoxin-disulfide reductase [Ignavibacteria bacterium]
MSNHHKVIVIGSGPAGFTAALYTGRANLNPIIFEGHQPGGQLMITTEVENYPGFEHGIQGPELMDVMRKQVHRFGAKSIYKFITKVDFSEKPFKMWTDDNELYTSDTVIVATGAAAKLLGLESEKKFMGFGVSACATCDGFFFRNQRVIVVGGGDTAMEEANYLTRHASEVTVIHRRDTFRASKIMFDRAKANPKIKFMTDTVIDEVYGTEEEFKKVVEGVKLRNLKTNEVTDFPVEGVFIAIGHQPNTGIFKGILDMDETGYLITKKATSETNIPGVFACGDAQDSYYRQAITAAGTGCMAAIDAERYLEAMNE